MYVGTRQRVLCSSRQRILMGIIFVVHLRLILTADAMATYLGPFFVTECLQLLAIAMIMIKFGIRGLAIPYHLTGATKCNGKIFLITSLEDLENLNRITLYYSKTS